MKLVKHALLVAAILVASDCGYRASIRRASVLADSWLGALPALQGTEMGSVEYDQTTIEKTAEARLLQLLTQTEIYAAHHGAVMQFFFVRYYAGTIVSLVLAIIAGVTLTLMSRKGWGDANRYIINIFLTSSSVLIFYAAFPSVFEQRNNIETNRNQYIEYVKLNSSIRTYIATRTEIGRTEASSAKQIDTVGLVTFVRNTQDVVNELHNISIGINHSNIPDVAEMLKTPTR